MKFGKVLKMKRTEMELTQSDLANLLHVSRQSVTKWETNRGYPPLDLLVEMSEIFGLSLDSLVKGDTAMTKAFSIQAKLSKYFKILVFSLCAILFGLLGYLGYSWYHLNNLYSEVRSWNVDDYGYYLIEDDVEYLIAKPNVFFYHQLSETLQIETIDLRTNGNFSLVYQGNPNHIDVRWANGPLLSQGFVFDESFRFFKSIQPIGKQDYSYEMEHLIENTLDNEREHLVRVYNLTKQKWKLINQKEVKE